MNTATMKIGQVAKVAGVATATIRFYEQRGLIPDPSRSESGYRYYGAGTVERLKFILRAKSLGFTLTEIREILELRTAPARDCSAVLAKAEDKLADVEAKIAHLEDMRMALQSLVRSCGGANTVEECHILNIMQGDEL